MGKLVTYTGGLFVLFLFIAFITLFNVLFVSFMFFKKIYKNQSLLPKDKKEFIITPISIGIALTFLGGIVGYYICLYTVIS